MSTAKISPKRRKAEPEQRRQAILDAGLAVFAAEGFAAAKLDDVAARAGVAKGTIYLHFRDKQDLFEQIVRNATAPILARLQQAVALPDMPIDQVLVLLFEMFRTEILATDRKLIARLVLTEGGRFPELAEFYHREVVAKGLALLRRATTRGIARGELRSAALERFPHLFFAPLLLAMMWDGLFAKSDPLDVEGLLTAHRELLTGSANPRRVRK